MSEQESKISNREEGCGKLSMPGVFSKKYPKLPKGTEPKPKVTF
jgi:hypothetical protein